MEWENCDCVRGGMWLGHCSGVVKCAVNDTDQPVRLTLTSWGGMANCPGTANACGTDNMFRLEQIAAAYLQLGH